MSWLKTYGTILARRFRTFYTGFHLAPLTNEFSNWTFTRCCAIDCMAFSAIFASVQIAKIIFLHAFGTGIAGRTLTTKTNELENWGKNVNKFVKYVAFTPTSSTHRLCCPHSLCPFMESHSSVGNCNTIHKNHWMNSLLVKPRKILPQVLAGIDTSFGWIDPRIGPHSSMDSWHKHPMIGNHLRRGHFLVFARQNGVRMWMSWWSDYLENPVEGQWMKVAGIFQVEHFVGSPLKWQIR